MSMPWDGEDLFEEIRQRLITTAVRIKSSSEDICRTWTMPRPIITQEEHPLWWLYIPGVTPFTSGVIEMV